MSLTKFRSGSLPELRKITDKDYKAIRFVSSLPIELGAKRLWMHHNIDSRDLMDRFCTIIRTDVISSRR